MIFSDRLRSLIDERNMTQKQLAQALAIPVSTLGGYVQGSSEPDFQTLLILAEYFNVTTDYLLGRPDSAARDAREDELLRIFRSLSSPQRDVYLDQGKSFIRFNVKSQIK